MDTSQEFRQASALDAQSPLRGVAGSTGTGGRFSVKWQSGLRVPDARRLADLNPADFQVAADYGQR